MNKQASGPRLRMEWGGSMGRQVSKKHYGRIWPNGNFSIGTGPAGQQALEDDGADEVGIARYGDCGDIGEAVASLISSSGTKSHKRDSELAQRGLNGITALGQQMLRSACYILDRDYGNHDLCFATLTVPALPPGARYLLAANWSELVRQLLQWVSRRLMKAGRPTKVCGCTEVQSGRLERTHEGYLHLHLVFPSHSNASGRLWAVEWAEMRHWWERALERFSCCRLPHHPRVELAPVRKSAERYMGKYLSKGSGEHLDAFVADVTEFGVPPAWWFMTADLRCQVKSETANGPNTGTLLHAVIDRCLEDGDMGGFDWIQPVMMTFTDRPVHIGWCGRLKPELRDELLTLLSPLL